MSKKTIYRNLVPVFFYVIVLLLSVGYAYAQQAAAAKENWVPLFNGKDIKAWVAKINHHEVGENYANTFRVEDGIIKVRYDQYKEFNERFGHLYYKVPYSYYRLKFEYRITGEWKKDAPAYTMKNSGVMFHSQDPATMPRDQDWPISVEFQLLAGLGNGAPRPTGNMCSPGTEVVFKGKIDPRHCIESSSKTYEAEQWVNAELIVLGVSLVTHIINGDTVLQYTKPQIGGGVVNNYNPSIKQDGKMLTEGFIALQSEGQPVDFRNIELLNLKGCTDPASKKYKSYFLKNDPALCK